MKYSLNNSVLYVEDKTFVTKDNQVIEYKDYYVILTLTNGQHIQVKIDKNDKKSLETIISIGLVEEIK